MESRRKSGRNSVAIERARRTFAVRSTNDRRRPARRVPCGRAARELGTSFRVPGQEARRLRKEPLAAQRQQRNGSEPADQKTASASRTPEAAGMAISPASVPPSGTHTIVTVTASGRCRDRHVLGRECRGVRDRAAKTEPGDEIASAQRRDAVDNGDRHRHHAEQDACCEQRDAAPEAIAERDRRWRRPPSCRDSRARSTGAKALRATDHSRMMVGIATPMSWLSMPSKMIVSAVRPTRRR